MQIKIEPLPDDCLPSPDVLDAVLRGPDIDPATGKITSVGFWQGKTVAEVLAERDAWNLACGGGD